MKRRAVIYCLLLAFAGSPICLDNVSAQQRHPADSITREQKEEFLRTAEIIQKRSIPDGITNPLKGTLTDGELTHAAVALISCTECNAGL